MGRRAVYCLGAISAVLAGPPWAGVSALARDVLSLPHAAWLDEAAATTPWQVGAMGTVGCALVLDHLHQSEPGGVGLVVTGDPGGWFGGVLLAADETP
jgi:hypothetical protein